jgi:hypothetical protein
LPEGQIVGQKTPNRSQKLFLGTEKVVAGKWPILYKSGRKESEHSFISIYRGISFWYAVFCGRIFLKSAEFWGGSCRKAVEGPGIGNSAYN